MKRLIGLRLFKKIVDFELKLSDECNIGRLAATLHWIEKNGGFERVAIALDLFVSTYLNR